MATELIPTATPNATLPAQLQQVAAYIDASLSPATRRAYRAGLADFRRWCAAQGLQALPAAPEVVAAYLADLAQSGKRVATIQQRVAALKWAHEAQGYESPTAAKGVRSTLAGIRRELGVSPEPANDFETPRF